MLNVVLENLLKEALLEKQKKGEYLAVAIMVKKGVYYKCNYSEVKGECDSGADPILMWRFAKMPSDEDIARYISNVVEYPEYKRKHN